MVNSTWHCWCNVTSLNEKVLLSLSGRDCAVFKENERRNLQRTAF